MRFPIFAVLLLAGFALLDTACKKPTPFGSELLTDEYADYDFTDTITVECSLLREDSINTSDRTGVASYFLCGQITNDPVFGTYRSDIYSLLIAETLNPQFKPDSTTVDSIVLYLNYAPAGVYGDTTQPQTLRVVRLSEPLQNDSTYFSNATLAEGAELGRLDHFLPRPHVFDSLFEGTKGAFLRIKLDNSFATELLSLDSLDWVSDSAFYRKLRGLKITCAADGGAQGAMLAFNLNNLSASRVALYYTEKGDTAQSRFDFYFRNANKFTHFDHIYPADLLAKIGQPLTDKMYVHGMQGLKLKVSFPYANNFNQIAVNKAQLVLTIADEDPWLLPAEQLVLTEFVGDSVYNFTNDALQAISASSTGSLATFGGFPEEEFDAGNNLVNRYRMSLSEKFQHIVDDDISPKLENRTVYVSVYPRSRSARRSILYGTDKNNPLRAKLELKYTRVK